MVKASGSKLWRASKAVPLARLVVIGKLALTTGRHLQKLDPDERRRLASLVVDFAKNRGAQKRGDREELRRLVAKLEPRELFGAAVNEMSPGRMPQRLLFGSKRRGRERRRRGRS